MITTPPPDDVDDVDDDEEEVELAKAECLVDLSVVECLGAECSPPVAGFAADVADFVATALLSLLLELDVVGRCDVCA